MTIIHQRTRGVLLVGNGSPPGSPGTSNHFVHQLVVVDSAGWVRHHLLTPVAHNDPGALSESDLLRRMKLCGGGGGALDGVFREEDPPCATSPGGGVHAFGPEAISPSQINLEHLRLTAAMYVRT